MANKLQIANYSKYNGLRTDCPPTKCPNDYSPDCSDMIFSVGGMETRHPFELLVTMPAEIVWRKEFTCKDGTVQILALDVNGVLYTVSSTGIPTQIGLVVPGSQVSSITAYGREYMAFYNAGGACDAPLQWDGRYLTRVTQGGPGEAPTVINYAIPPSQLIAGTSGTGIAISTITPTDQETVQVGGGSDNPYDDSGYDPPSYQTYYTTLTVVTSIANGLSVGENVSISGNSLWNVGVASIIATPNLMSFVIGYQQQSGAVGTGGTVTPSAPLLVRLNNEVTAATASPHQLRRGYQVTISGVMDQPIGGSVTSIVINNTQYPGLAQITTSAANSLSPGQTVTLAGVANVLVGGGINTLVTLGDQTTVTTNNPHNLQVGAQVLIQTATGPYLPFLVSSVTSPLVFSYPEDHTDATRSGGSVTLVWPGNQEQTQDFVVDSVDSPNVFYVPLSYSNGTWTSGTLTYAWNGTFYVTSVPSATTFTYRQNGPNLLLQSGTGTVTPKGQLPAGDHLVCQHWINRNGTISPPSPPFKFTASGNQFPLVQNLAIGPANIVGRAVSFTGANGGSFAILLIPGQVNGLQISTSTVVNDNVTTSALFDFADLTLLSATRIDIPGFNLFQNIPLNLPDAVNWFKDRLFWKGEKNVVLGFINLGMDGGTANGSTSPLGWISAGSGVVTQIGVSPALQISGPDAGLISQGAAYTAQGVALFEPNLRYSFRVWASGSGTFKVTISSASTLFSSVAVASVGSAGYIVGSFSLSMPTNIPSDLMLSVEVGGIAAGSTAAWRDLQLIYADNPNRWPIARASYVRQPEMYDADTGDIGPNDDSSELRAMFVLQESFHFITAKGRLYYVQSIGNSEPSSWNPDGITDKCSAFNQNSVVTGKGWAAWGGKDGAFWYSGGIPEKVSAIISPSWRSYTGMCSMYNDSDQERVYFGMLTGTVKSMLVYDYHEVGLEGPGKWSPWNRPLSWAGSSASGTVFVFGQRFFAINPAQGTLDDILGEIGAYYTFAPAGMTPFLKAYQSIYLRVSGSGILTPFTMTQTLDGAVRILNGQELSVLQDTVAEWPDEVRGRVMFLRLGQANVQYSLEDATIVFQDDPNSPISGVR